MAVSVVGRKGNPRVCAKPESMQYNGKFIGFRARPWASSSMVPPMYNLEQVTFLFHTLVFSGLQMLVSVKSLT